MRLDTLQGRSLNTALSRNPVVTESANVSTVVAKESSDKSILENDPLPEKEQQLAETCCLQREDPELMAFFLYLEDGKLPDNPSTARWLALEKSRFEIIDGILHFENPAAPGKLWRIAVPKELRSVLLSEAHDGKFAGHFGEQKVYNLLRKLYWWDGMRADVQRYCRSCLICATHKGTGRASRPPLQPIPVGGPFHRVDVDTPTNT